MSENKIYSITDVETTGGKANQHKITEIAIIKFDGEKIVDEYKTLINPERNIPQFITQLTGITNEMVAGAPKFYEVAKKIVEFTEDTVFVAHNVYFDYNIIKREFADLGFVYKKPKLCTVKLARKFIPGHKSYSLGKVCADLDIPLRGRHRAYGDAAATVELFKLILEKQKNSDLELEIESSQKISLPAGLNHSDIDDLPETIGVYIFKNKEGHIIYVGKSKNIQKRVKSHLSTNLKKTKDLQIKASISMIETIEIGHEWAALILEAHLIKKHRPLYNRALNRKNFRYGLKKTNQNSSLDLKVTTNMLEITNSYFLYRSKKTAESSRNRIYKECFGFEYGGIEHEKYLNLIPSDVYNKQLDSYLNKLDYPFRDFQINLKVFSNPLILNFIDNKIQSIEWDSNRFPIEEDPDIKRLVLKQLNRYKNKIVNTENNEDEFGAY